MFASAHSRLIAPHHDPLPSRRDRGAASHLRPPTPMLPAHRLGKAPTAHAPDAERDLQRRDGGHREPLSEASSPVILLDFDELERLRASLPPGGP
jgi:hypothetical protein